MPRFVVLLRGVNVGKANRVPMADFRALLEMLGLADVRTLLNSGNAVFSAARGTPAGHAKAVRGAIEERLGVSVPVVVKSGGEIAAAVTENTLDVPADAHSRLLVAFAQDRSAIRGIETIAPLVRPGERLLVGRHAAYLLCQGGILESKAAGALLGKAGQAITTRNWATVLKLRELVG